jgi:hypothetical protein
MPLNKGFTMVGQDGMPQQSAPPGGPVQKLRQFLMKTRSGELAQRTANDAQGAEAIDPVVQQDSTKGGNQ